MRLALTLAIDGLEKRQPVVGSEHDRYGGPYDGFTVADITGSVPAAGSLADALQFSCCSRASSSFVRRHSRRARLAPGNLALIAMPPRIHAGWLGHLEAKRELGVEMHALRELGTAQPSPTEYRPLFNMKGSIRQ